MSIICPTVLAHEPHEFREQMERIISFAPRIQIDLTDGEFAPTKTLPLDRIWWPEDIQIDIHLMYQRPTEHLAQLINQKPHMVIIHFEADVDHLYFAQTLQKNDIKAGLCLLKDTSAREAEHLLSHFDHALIFSGDLGKFGGQVDLSQLEKVDQIKQINPQIEIGWDGGANAASAVELSRGGIDVINVGSAIQQASSSQEAYDTIKALVETEK